MDNDRIGDAAQPTPEEEVAAFKRRLAAVERENKSLRIAVAELERISERDTLTPLYNRRYFISALSSAIARAGRYGERGTLVFCDLNGLKQINDGHGHAAGDFALITVAQRLADAVRSTDTIARLGGDEFGVILEKTDRAAAEEKVRQLSSALDEDCRYGDTPLSLSAAFGVIEIRSGVGGDDLIAEADRNMYVAKRDARNGSKG